MSYEILRVLGNWPATAHGASVVPVADAQGLSGATVWRVEASGNVYALKRWPGNISSDRLQDVHDFQGHLARHFPALIPVLQTTVHGETSVFVSQRLWELATWMSGAADFVQNPSAARLNAAMSALAVIHNKPTSLREGYVYDDGSPVLLERRFPQSLEQREVRLDEIVAGDLRVATANIKRSAQDDQRHRLIETIGLIARLAPGERRKLYQLRDADFRLQYRLGDVHDGHVLFTGDEVTAIIDFGAADYDAPVGDVARLLGSLAGDDRDRWRRGLAAYTAIRPLTNVELIAVDIFDTSGTVISAANWLNWLWGDDLKRLQVSDYSRPMARLTRLTERLRSLAATSE